MATVNAEDLEDAVLMVSEAGTEAKAWVSLDTGEVHVRPGLMDGEPVALPDVDTGRHVPVPTMGALDLGLGLVFDFADAALPDDAERVREMFKRAGGYREFSDLVEEHGLAERWHDFREAQTRAVLAAWCGEHGLELG